MKVDEGRVRIEEVVDETVAVVLDDIETTPELGEPGYCTDETSTIGYEQRFSLEDLDIDTLFDETIAYWEELGFTTNVENKGSDLPAVFAEDDDGFTYSLQINPEDGDGWVGGGTPCLEND